jgi:putative heme-binding domain-containing protein
VEAVQLWSELPEGPQQIRALLKSENIAQAARLAEILGLFGNARAHKILSDVAADGERVYDVRSAAVSGLARHAVGEKTLLALAESKQLVGDTRLLAGALLARSSDGTIKSRAAEILPQPAQKDQKPLAPLDQLAKMRGDSENGKQLFRGVATCSKCHIVSEFGKEVGPNLSEIGSKLSREAMLTSILDPSAGISHNYENYIVLTDEGQVISGLKVSETGDEVVIRTNEAIDRKIATEAIEEIKKSDKSIMPENLHHAFDQQGLIDIVEYMQSLKKKG